MAKVRNEVLATFWPQPFGAGPFGPIAASTRRANRSTIGRSSLVALGPNDLRRSERSNCQQTLYWSITLTSLICATYGGGTGLATQRECLEMLGCYGQGGADKFAEICAATVLAGETSLSSAILAGDWVSSHDQLGRNRP